MSNPANYENAPDVKLAGSNKFPGLTFQRPTGSLSGLFRDYVVNNNLLLGHGGFGQVFAGERRSDKRQVAIKIVPKEQLKHWIEGRPLEQVMLARLQGIPGVLELYDQGMLSDGAFAIITERLKGPDLFDYINDRAVTMVEDEAQSIFAQVFRVVVKCYENGIVHRDIKDENIMFYDTGKVKLIDFGCATFVNVNDGDGKLRKMEGTRAFATPEWLNTGFYYAESSTVWQLGTLLYSMLNGDIPFHNDPEILSARVHWRRSVSSVCRELVESCLRLDPLKRPSLSKIASHEWVKAVDVNIPKPD
jgi:serine/threonine protein kinase